MGAPESLTADLVQRYRKLGDQGRAVIGGFAKAFPGATVEWISQADADQRHKAGERFNEYCDTIIADVMEMKNNMGLLRQHRSATTLAKLEMYRQRDRKRFLGLLFPRGSGYIDVRAIKRDATDEQDKIRTRLVLAGDLQAVESFIKRCERECRDIYVGIASR